MQKWSRRTGSRTEFRTPKQELHMIRPFALWATAIAFGAGLTTAQDFPLRAKYPMVKPISTAELAASPQAVVFDVRAVDEFDVIHIANCINVPVAKASFLPDFEKAAKNQKDALIVTYCNGVTCEKSYDAAAKAIKAGYANTKVYDEGIMAWAKAQPGKTTLLGKTPLDPKKLISKDAFEAKRLPLAEFEKRSAQPSAFLIDSRDAMQRKVIPAYLAKAANFPFDKLVAQLANAQFKEKLQGKTLFIVDAVGKQTQWLQYYLEDADYKDYYFLKDGVDGK
jgi:rhodanese-related sulfurtransferase